MDWFVVALREGDVTEPGSGSPYCHMDWLSTLGAGGGLHARSAKGDEAGDTSVCSTKSLLSIEWEGCMVSLSSSSSFTSPSDCVWIMSTAPGDRACARAVLRARAELGYSRELGSCDDRGEGARRARLVLLGWLGCEDDGSTRSAYPQTSHEDAPAVFS